MYAVHSHRSTGPVGEAWAATVSDVHGAMSISSPSERYRGRVEWQSTAAFQVVRWWGGAERLTRDARHVRRDTRGTFELVVPLAGVVELDQAGRRWRVAPGEMALVDVDQPWECAHGDGVSALTVVMARERVAARLGDGGAQAARLPAAAGVGRVVRMLATTLHEERAALTGSAFDAACDRLVDLACLAIARPRDPGTSGHRDAVERSIRAFARTHAARSDLTGQVLADGLGWSLRYVQAILREAGTTPSALIREERLQLAHATLLARRDRPVTQVALDSGFRSPSAFSTAFRARFGIAPRDLRA